MKLLALLSFVAGPLLATTSAQQPSTPRDTRPIYAYLALPRIGTAVPDFNYKLAGGGSLTPASVRGAPAVLVLWSTWCGASRAVLEAVESLHAEYASRGVHVVILAADSMADLDRFRSATAVNTPLASASDLMERFDFSSSAPERDSLRVQLALPSVLVLDAAGRVMSRDIVGRSSFTRLRATLDSLMQKHH